ncbi:MAG: GAF domain-containing protein [Acidobacteriota bacterium]|jgi:signal transduction protein with GAF and PtsI domain|nr:GAF domain-containing protein [Acidobacteriota bacterium]
MSEINEHNLEKKLRQVIETVDTANSLTVPLTDTIVNLLETSSALMNSEEASVLIKDGNEGDLRFLCAIGQVADQLAGLKVPAGKGIAGFVFSSGQPLTVTNVEEEESFYPEVDRQTGFSTQTILATPLIYKGNFVGVLEYVNRIGEPPFEPFTPDEMNTAALYADAIAGIVNAYESAGLFKDLSKEILSSEKPSEVTEIRKWLKDVRGSKRHREMIDLAVLIREVANRGDAERVLCKDILESFVNYTKNDLNSKFSRL